MNKQELIGIISESAEIPKVTAERAFNAFIQTIILGER